MDACGEYFVKAIELATRMKRGLSAYVLLNNCMTRPEAVMAMIHSAVTRMREQSTRDFRSQWSFTVDVKLNDLKMHIFVAEARAWLEANCSGHWALRLDIEVVGFTDEAEAVAFALFSSA